MKINMYLLMSYYDDIQCEVVSPVIRLLDYMLDTL